LYLQSLTLTMHIVKLRGTIRRHSSTRF
jgi:hypothetical protein